MLFIMFLGLFLNRFCGAAVHIILDSKCLWDVHCAMGMCSACKCVLGKWFGICVNNTMSSTICTIARWSMLLVSTVWMIGVYNHYNHFFVYYPNGDVQVAYGWFIRAYYWKQLPEFGGNSTDERWMICTWDVQKGPWDHGSSKVTRDLRHLRLLTS